jgi:hypothetical protein
MSKTKGMPAELLAVMLLGGAIFVVHYIVAIIVILGTLLIGWLCIRWWLVRTFGGVKGSLGEWKVRSILRKALPKNYQIFTNVIIPFKDSSSQIDCVVIGPAGVFTIEVKTYSGNLYGKPQDYQWTQEFVTQRGIKSFPFYNPLLQNETHRIALRDFLKIEDTEIFNIVVFAGSATLRLPTDIRVTQKSNLVSRLQSYKRTMDFHKVSALAHKVTLHKKQQISSRQHLRNIGAGP